MSEEETSGGSGFSENASPQTIEERLGLTPVMLDEEAGNYRREDIEGTIRALSGLTPEQQAVAYLRQERSAMTDPLTGLL